MGLSNYVTESDWLDSLIKLFTREDSHGFVDVGTNIGQTLIKAKSIRPKLEYIGFEPNSSCVIYLQDLIKTNNFKNCTIINCALFSSVQFLNLEKNLSDDLRASVVSLLRPAYFKEKESVMAINYDSFFLDKKISFVKIDAEGSELEIIEGMKKSIQKYKPIIVCEVLDSHNAKSLNFTQSRATELCRLMQAIDYVIFHLIRDQLHHQILDFKKVNDILIKQWTTESISMNDYLFCPSDYEADAIDRISHYHEINSN